MIELYGDLTGAGQALHHPWRTCVGSGHATLALRADWQAQLRQASAELGFRYVRFHGLLDDDMGTLICQSNEFVYSFFNADQIFDFLIAIGMRPIVELSFMPSTLSSGDNIVFHYKGNITPPRHIEKWAELMRRLAAHWSSAAASTKCPSGISRCGTSRTCPRSGPATSSSISRCRRPP